MKSVGAFDLGASNGRLMESRFDGKRFEIEGIHRFANQPVFLTGHYYWDILHLFQEMKNGLNKWALKGTSQMESLSIDTWGVDFGLLSATGELLGNPYSYRDQQTNEHLNEIFKKIPKEKLFYRTGNEPAAINTICQLYAIKTSNPDLLEKAETLLLTPNLLSYFFSGEKANEYTISTTTSLYHIHGRNWDVDLMKKIGLSSTLMADLVEPGTILGPTMEAINKEIGIQPIQVIAGAGHDTACALAALPIQTKQAAFMSCGTWILMGVQVKEPVLTKKALEWGFTNEGTVDGEYRLLKNTMGLWLIQQCKQIWAKEGIVSTYDEDARLIEQTRPFQCLIDPDDSQFFNPVHMPKQIRSFCLETNQTPPEKMGEFLRCILESLALTYRWVLEKIESLTGERIEVIHMGGGGIQNEFLCQYTANATNRTVIAGPVEASSIGNALTQWVAIGEIKDFSEGREIIADSFLMKKYEPNDQLAWQEAYGQFIKQKKRGLVYEND